MEATAVTPANKLPVSHIAPCVGALASKRSIRVGLLGCGTVGAAVARRLRAGDGAIEKLAGAPVELGSVAVRSPEKDRRVDLAGCVTTGDPWRIAIDPGIDVVVEVIGGIEPARELVRAALRDGKSVVTANKQLIAAHGDELSAVARARGVQLRYDAAVGGGTPVLAFVKNLRAHGLRRVAGVLNGTTNFVLEAMATGVTLEDALARARRLGLAERDATLDLEGGDTAAKACIVAAAAFGRALDGTAIPYEGISRVTAADVRAAAAAGRVLKLVAVIERRDDRVDAEVRVSSLPASDPLARLRGWDNGVTCTTDLAGDLTLTGPGAGGDPTAAAIIGDIARIVAAHR
jgi:homoserine dehydrogenase